MNCIKIYRHYPYASKLTSDFLVSGQLAAMCLLKDCTQLITWQTSVSVLTEPKKNHCCKCYIGVLLALIHSLILAKCKLNSHMTSCNVNSSNSLKTIEIDKINICTYILTKQLNKN